MLPRRGSTDSFRTAAPGRVLLASTLASLGVLAAVRPVTAQCPDGRPLPCARPAVTRPASIPTPNSVAVMYLDNQSNDTSDAYLADGLTEEITTKLGQVGRLTVTSNTVMRRYRGGTLEPAALGRALRVTQLVSGSVRRSGHRIRVNVELLRARDGVQLWADSYDRTDADLLAIEEDVARQVATAIAGRLLPGERASLAARSTRSPEAYDHYLRGNFLLAQRSPAAARRAIAEYQTAVARDPSFARALGRLGLAYSLFLDWGWPYPGLSGDSLLVLAAAAADRAVALDSLDADAWLARGYSLSYLRPTTFAGVVPALERAVALDPRNAEAHHQLAGQLFCLRRDSDAVREYRRALALDPGRGISWDNYATLRYYERQYDEARRLADSGLAAEPRAYYLYVDRANLSLTVGDLDGARAAIDAAIRTRPADYVISSDALVAALEAHAGDTAAARARLEALTSALPDRSHPDYSQGSYLALGFLRAGARGRALELLEAVWPRGLNFGNQLRDPGFDPIRDDPRFQALVAQTRPPEAP